MENITETMRMVLDNCQIMLDGNVISEEKLIETYSEFLAQTIEKCKHNVGFVMHSGSICFDVMSVTYAAITNLLSNKTNSNDILQALHKGDIVIFGAKKKERYVFDEIIADGGMLGSDYKGKKYVKLLQNNKTVYISESQWRLIEPYNGKSQRLDGRGIRRRDTARDDFFVKVLGFNKEDIPSVVDTSTVLVMTKDCADELIKGISIKFDNKEVKLLDVVTASYYTEEDEYPYGGNTSKNEPILKICAKLSVARSLILARNGNRHIGIMVLGQEVINRGQSELLELMKRKSLQYVYVCTTLDAGVGMELLDDNEDIEVFACTKDFLLEHTSTGVIIPNQLTFELEKQITTVINKNVESVLINEFGISNEEYKLFKNSLLRLKRNQYESEIKDSFIIQAHSLMNLFLTAVFPVMKINQACENGLIQIDNPANKLQGLKDIVVEMPYSLQEEAQNVIDVLEKEYYYLFNTTPKYEWLRKHICENRSKQIALVVPKAYYISIIKNGGLYSPVLLKNICIMTVSRFDNTKSFDEIIVVGDFEGKRFNAFNCNASMSIISLLYSPEIKSFSYRKKAANEVRRKIDCRSTIQISEITEKEDSESVEQDVDYVETEKELDEYISNLDSVIDTYKLSNFSQGGKANITTEIVAVATFADESKAFFSKHYKAYVLDADSGIVREVGATDLCEGDSVVFTKNNNETKDIVDSFVHQMIIEGKMPTQMTQTYKKAKEWQQCLWDYMEQNQYSARQVAEQMITIGAPVQEPTILRWLDEDAHTIGPRNVESLKAIGKVTGNKELEDNAALYFEACREIRGLRRRILGEIGRAIINKIGGKSVSGNSEFNMVYDKIDSLSEVLQIERIMSIETILPLNVANRPINV